MITKLGFYKLSMQDYLTDPALDVSFLKKFARSGKHAKEETKETPAMLFGTCLHWNILEPKEFIKNVREKKSGYAERKNGFIYLKTDDIKSIKTMKCKVWQKKTARRILKNAYAKELGGFFQLWTGQMAKVRIDIITDFNGPLIVDLKKTVDASEEGFYWQIKKYKYHWQAAFYLEAVSKITGIEHDRFGIMPCEDKLPHECGFYMIGDDWLEQAWREMQPLIDKYTVCKEQDKWEGYPDEFVNLGLKRSWQ